MGLVYADIKLINGEDLVLAKRHIIGEEEVKEMMSIFDLNRLFIPFHL